MEIDLTINPEKTTKEIVDFIRKTVKRAGFERMVVGLSGGVDSATACVLAVRALGKANATVVMLPYGDWHKQTVLDTREFAGQLDISSSNRLEIDIKSLIEPFFKLDKGMDELRCGNIMVRVRMIILYDLAKKQKALVLGTENKTEYLLGYFTRFGDEAADIESIRHLYKTQVRQLAKYLNVPNKIMQKPPTAGMWPGQTDEGEFGFTYEEADQILNLYIDKKMAKREIIKVGFAKETVEKVIKRMKENEFKHQLPHVF